MYESYLVSNFFEDNQVMIDEAMEWEDIEYDGDIWSMIDEYRRLAVGLYLSNYKGYHDSIVPFISVAAAIDSVRDRNDGIGDNREPLVSWKLFEIVSEITDYLDRGDFSKILRVVDGERIEYVNRPW